MEDKKPEPDKKETKDEEDAKFTSINKEKEQKGEPPITAKKDTKDDDSIKTKEPTIEDKYKDLEAKYKTLLDEKVTRDRAEKHDATYKKYDLSDENVGLLKRYLSNNDDIEDEMKTLNKEFPHLFNKNKSTNINKSLDVKDKQKTNNEEVDTSRIGMVG